MDIVEQLRGEQKQQQDDYGRGLAVLDDAADEIARLRDENASLSAQLIAFQTAWPGGVDEVSSSIQSLRDESAVLRTQLTELQVSEVQLREYLNARLKAERLRCAGVCDDDEHKYETGRCCAIAIRDLSDEPIHIPTEGAAMQKGE